jgi:hypothetical protein
MDPDLFAYVGVLVGDVNNSFLKDANEMKKKYDADMISVRRKNIPTKNKRLIFLNLTKNYNSKIRKLMLKRRNDVKQITDITRIVPGKNYRKFALIVGINYTGDPSRELKGAVSDALNIGAMLRNYGYNTVILADAPGYLEPTLVNITEKFISLLQNKVTGDSLFFYFNGHATFIDDSTIHPDERDGKDEIITTIDYNPETGQPNYLTDDILKTLITNNLATGVTLTCLIDACNSGTILDLKYNYERIVIISNPASVETNGQVILLSSSRDNQLSGEALITDNGKTFYGGIFTYAFNKVFDENRNNLLTYNNLLTSIQQKTTQLGFAGQTAQLSFGRLMDPKKTYFYL